MRLSLFRVPVAWFTARKMSYYKMIYFSIYILNHKEIVLLRQLPRLPQYWLHTGLYIPWICLLVHNTLTQCECVTNTQVTDNELHVYKQIGSLLIFSSIQRLYAWHKCLWMITFLSQMRIYCIPHDKIQYFQKYTVKTPMPHMSAPAPSPT